MRPGAVKLRTPFEFLRVQKTAFTMYPFKVCFSLTVMISAVDLRDAIQEAGLRTLLIDNVMRRASDSGIRIEGNRTDPIFQKLIKALDQVGLPCKVKNENGYHLALRIGRRS